MHSPFFLFFPRRPFFRNTTGAPFSEETRRHGGVCTRSLPGASWSPAGAGWCGDRHWSAKSPFLEDGPLKKQGVFEGTKAPAAATEGSRDPLFQVSGRIRLSGTPLPRWRADPRCGQRCRLESLRHAQWLRPALSRLVDRTSPRRRRRACAQCRCAASVDGCRVGKVLRT